MLATTKDIDVAVREYIRPILKKAGFTRFENRTAWRHREHSIDVVAVTCVGVIRCTDPDTTPCSFVVEAGIYLPYIPYEYGASPPCRNGKLFPREVDCFFRYPDLGKPVPQMFEIRPDGSNIRSSIAAAAELIVIDMLPWMNQYATPDAVFDALMARYEKFPSPKTGYYLGFTAKRIGKRDIAREWLQAAINSDANPHKRAEILKAIGEC